MLRGNEYERRAQKWYLNSKEYYSAVYKARCLHCGKEFEVMSQYDANPEYRTYLALKCPTCGNRVYFELPVN